MTAILVIVGTVVVLYLGVCLLLAAFVRRKPKVNSSDLAPPRRECTITRLPIFKREITVHGLQKVVQLPPLYRRRRI
jgi:hypothetical protein